MASQEPTDPTLTAGSQYLTALSILRTLDPHPRSTAAHQTWSPRLPCISTDRIQQASANTPPPPSAPVLKTATPFPPDQEPTILYLAYGSNLCAETFQGRRGIRPLAATNVVVPRLRMTFDLPGIPYAEPCFANTADRTVAPPYPPQAPPKTTTTTTPSHQAAPPSSHRHHKHRQGPAPQPTWPHGLVGVVYEVTPTDYAHIIATEGGGAGYQDILTACHPLPVHSPCVPSEPSTPPFYAHTLFAPRLPPSPPTQPKRSLPRPSPPRAQPSPRYLALIRAGAAEHALPPDYTAYLAELRAYAPTSQAQRVGRFVFLTIWLPVVIWLLGLGRVYGGEGGRSPGWLVWLLGRVMEGMWECYDGLFRGVFGEGEWTVEGEGEGERDGWGEEGVLLGGVDGEAV